MNISSNFTENEKQEIKQLITKGHLNPDIIDSIVKTSQTSGFLDVSTEIFSDANDLDVKYFKTETDTIFNNYVTLRNAQKNYNNDNLILLLYCNSDKYGLTTTIYHEYDTLIFAFVNFTTSLEYKFINKWDINEKNNQKGLDNFLIGENQMEVLQPYIYNYYTFANYRNIPLQYKNCVTKLEGLLDKYFIEQFNRYTYENIKKGRKTHILVDGGDQEWYYNEPCHVDLMSTGIFFENDYVYII